MNVKRLDEHTVGLLGLDSIFRELLHQIVPSADPGDDAAAKGRIFASPTAGKEPEFDAEWRSYVEPGLRELFQSHLDVVANDLRDLPRQPKEEPSMLAIPMGHLDHWLGALNQARLALASRYHLEEQDLE